jgi:hypothetical protein
MRHGLAHHLRALRSEQCLVDLGLVRGRAVKWLVLMSEDKPFTDGERPERLVPGCRREPGTNSVRVLDPVDVLDQPHPGRLENVRRVTLDELEVPGDRPDEPTVLMDQALPSLRIAVGSPPHQSGRVEVRDVGADWRRAPDG